MRSPAFRDYAPIVLLLVATAAVFHDHILGNLTFPWDFHGPYISHAVARMRDGTFLSPPLWMPWGGFGVPSHQSLQDGTWYLPQYLFDFFGWHYDLVGATRLHVAHVFLGAIGVNFFVRRIGASHAAACVAALAFVFNPAFFSNGQHVDIARGTAMLPWLFLALINLYRFADAWRFIAFVLVLWQFLVGAYPGMIVAAAYACAMVSVFEVHFLRKKTDSPFPIVLVALAVTTAVGLSMVKFLPALADIASSRQSVGDVSGVPPELLTTLLFGFDLDGMPNDLSMRDLFVGLPILWLAMVGTIHGGSSRLPYALFVMASIPLVADPSVQSVVAKLPLMDISRFHISDFRPIMHLAVLIFSAYGIDRLARSDEAGIPVLAIAISTASIITLSVYAWRLGQPKELFVWLAVSALCMLPAIFIWSRNPDANRATSVIAASLISAVAVSGYGHILHSERVWRMPRSDELEIAAYGSTIRELLAVSRSGAIEHRPRRFVVSSLPAKRDELYDERYNFAWFAQSYAAFGYKNMSESQMLKAIYTAASSPERTALTEEIEWMIERSSVQLRSDIDTFDPRSLDECIGTCAVPQDMEESKARMIAFRQDGAVYQIEARSALVLVENEPYYSGWTALICDMDGVCADDLVQSQRVGQVLRGWRLPQGKYRLVTFYRPPAWGMAARITQASSLVAVFSFLVLLFAVRNRYAKPNHPPPTS